MNVVQIEEHGVGDVIVVTTRHSTYELRLLDPRKAEVELSGGRFRPQTCRVYWGRIEVGNRLALQIRTGRARDFTISAVQSLEVRKAA